MPAGHGADAVHTVPPKGPGRVIVANVVPANCANGAQVTTLMALQLCVVSAVSVVATALAPSAPGVMLPSGTAPRPPTLTSAIPPGHVAVALRPPPGSGTSLGL